MAMLVPLLASSSFFLTNAACGQTNKQKKQEKKKLDAYLGPTLALAWVPRRLQPLHCSKLPSKLLLQAPLLRARSRSTSLELWRWSEGGRGW